MVIVYKMIWYICFFVFEMYVLNRNFYYVFLFLLCVGCEYGDRKIGCKKD